MTAELPKSELELMEDQCYDALVTAESNRDIGNALTALGLTQLHMEPSKLGGALQKIWAGMHGRSGTENLGILAVNILGPMFNSGVLRQTREHADVLRSRRHSQPNQQ